jgi:peptide/nickel transport system substrate-binding protein
MTRRQLLALLVAGALILAGCSPNTSPRPSLLPGQTPASSSAPDVADLFDTAYSPEAGGTGGGLTVGDWQEASEFNPYYLRLATEASVASAAWASLVTLTGNDRYAPDLATEIPTLENGGVKVPGDGSDAMTVTWKLKAGLKWSDGQDLTCDDFKYAWQWVLEPRNNRVISAGWNQIAAVDCPSPTELVLHFTDVYEGYINLITAPLPRHYLEPIPIADQVRGAGFRAEDLKNLPVSGPFKFDAVFPAAELRLVRNDNYQGWKSRKAANLDTLVFKWYGEPDALIGGFENGDVDVALGLGPTHLPDINAQGLHDQVVAVPALLYEFLRPNWADGTATDLTSGVGGCSRNPLVTDRGAGCPMADQAMRLGVAAAIDRSALIKRLFDGNVDLATTNVSPGAWFHADLPAPAFDPAKAKAILDQAGWALGSDGIRAKGKLRAKIELCTTDAGFRTDAVPLLVGWLKDVGIEAVPDVVSANDLYAGFDAAASDAPCALSHGNFDLALQGFTAPIDPLGNYYSYDSSQFEPNGVNDAQVADPAIDTALERVRNSVDFVAVKRAMADFQSAYLATAAEIPLYYNRQVSLVNSRVGNFFANATQGGPTWNVVDWFVKP